VRIAKYLHSCLLIEHAGENLLFDPGRFSFVEGRVEPATFGDVDVVVLTHDHPDHIELPALERIVAASGATVVGNGEVAARLRQHGIETTVLDEGTLRVGAFALRAVPADHEPILAKTTPRNTAFLVNERLLNPGDSFRDPLLTFAGVDALVLPVMAPFLTEVAAFGFGRRMRPGAVIPVHDGYAKEFFVRLRYEAYGAAFAEHGIRFHPLIEPGASVEI